MKILLCEDDEIIAKGLIYSFNKKGYDLIHKSTIKESSDYISNYKIDIVVLDISMPDGSGFKFYADVIKPKNIPTIFLTARDDENDIVRGLELGAEDYITKPFFVKELVARIDKVLARSKKNLVIKTKDISYDMDKMVVYRNTKKIEFTSLELKILHLLFLNINKVVTRNEIIDKVWDWTGNDINDNTVTVYLKRIREKLQTDIIVTIKGIGYRIDKDEK